MPSPSLYTFVHASDTHWGIHTDAKWALAGERSAAFEADLAALSPRPAFVLITGDISNRGSDVRAELNAIKTHLLELPVPTYVVPGNHDLSAGPREGKSDRILQPLTETGWYQLFGDAGLFWVQVHPPLEFIGFALRNGDPDGLLDRLERHLERPTTNVRVLACHYPVYPARTTGTLEKWGPHHIGESLERLRTILRKHSDTVALYLYGHVHALAASVIDGILHASGGAVAVGAPGYRLFQVHPEGIASRFFPLSESSLAEFSFWGSTKTKNAVDPLHPSVELYHKGTKEERDFFFDFRTRAIQALD